MFTNKTLEKRTVIYVKQPLKLFSHPPQHTHSDTRSGFLPPPTSSSPARALRMRDSVASRVGGQPVLDYKGCRRASLLSRSRLEHQS